jgi:hypothetical protein
MTTQGRTYAEMLGVGLPTNPAHGAVPKGGLTGVSPHTVAARVPDFSVADEGGSVDPTLAAALAARVAPGQRNVFDQFDAEPAAASMDPSANPMAADKPGANPFDQFDEPQHGEAQPSLLEDVINSAGTGLARGAAGVVGLPGDFFQLINKGMDAAHDLITGKEHPPTPMPGWLSTSEKIRNVASDITGVTLPEPKTQLVGTAAELDACMAGWRKALAEAGGTEDELATVDTIGTLLSIDLNADIDRIADEQAAKRVPEAVEAFNEAVKAGLLPA